MPLTPRLRPGGASSLLRTAFWLAVAVVTCGNSPITLRPGDDVQSVVADAPEGAVFIFEPGIYRLLAFNPKSRQQFIGKTGTIFNGAMVLSDWRNEGGVWIADGLPPPRHRSGPCADDDSELCKYREDLFFDGQLYQRVATQDQLETGRWFSDDRSVYLVDDPSGKLVEVGVVPRAMGGDATGVLLQNLIVEKYASKAQQGAIDGSAGWGWTVIDVTARWNHGMGLGIGERMRVDGGSYSWNGQLGMGGKGDGAVIENVEIAHNNYARYSWGWEAGGVKFVTSTGLTVRNACVHHNLGPGLWLDIDNTGILIEGNKVFDNAGSGIKYEISHDAVIRENVVAGNGGGKDNWLWGAQILVQNSRNVEVHGNVVYVAAGYGDGLGIIHQDRGEGTYGPRTTLNNRVHHNRVTHFGDTGENGLVRDFEDPLFADYGNNKFDYNTYVVAAAGGGHWRLVGSPIDWVRFRQLGMEANGVVVEDAVAPVELTCSP